MLLKCVHYPISVSLGGMQGECVHKLDFEADGIVFRGRDKYKR